MKTIIYVLYKSDIIQETNHELFMSLLSTSQGNKIKDMFQLSGWMARILVSVWADNLKREV